MLGPPLRGPLTVTSPYGWRSVLGVRDFHTGVDFAARTGTPVYAAAGGTARRVGNFGGGKGIAIDHGGGTATEYWHLSSQAISGTMPVRAGQLIGWAGASGARITGAHLHFEVKVGGQHVDPSRYIGVGNPNAGFADAAVVGANPAGTNPGDAVFGRAPIGYLDGYGPGNPGPRARDDAGEYFPNVRCSPGFIARPAGLKSDPRCFPAEQGAGFAGVRDQVKSELAEDLGEFVVDTVVPVALNVGVIVIAVRLGWVGVQQVLEARR